MVAETIQVYIDPEQLKAQQANNYSLYLAKKVNNVFTVIWQSYGAIGTVNHPGYEYHNTFEIAVPAYQVNYGSVKKTQGSVTFSSGGQPVTMDLGQTVTLDKGGQFGAPENGGPAGVITVENAMLSNPHEILCDASGNPLFVNTESGMDVGNATLTPIDEYQIWFDNFQRTGTIIAHNASNPKIVTFDGGSTSKTISYNKEGVWQDGPLQAPELELGAVAGAGGLAVTIAATFSSVLTTGAVTYLLSKFIDKFSSGLKPSHIITSVGSCKLEVVFDEKEGPLVYDASLDGFQDAVRRALIAAQKDRTSGLAGENWVLNETQLNASF